jgi:ABC-type lipoprotein release transport system permease subunit
MPKEYLVNNISQLETEIAAIPGTEVIEERIRFNVLLSHKDSNEPAVAIGINPQKTDKNMELSKTIVEGQYFEKSELCLIIGKKLANKLKVTIGDELLLVTTDINYSTYALPFKIKGIFETGFSNMDKHILYIPFTKAQEMLDCGDASHEILVFIRDPQQAVTVSEKIKGIISKLDQTGTPEVIPWQNNNLIESIPLMASIFDKILGIIMFIVALVILNTMLMSVMERYHEIGVIKALGFKNREVFFMILTEAAYIGIIGSVIGGILGGSLSAVIEKVGFDISTWGGGVMEKIDIPIPFFGKMIYPDFTLDILVSSLIFGVVVSLLAVLYPAFKSSKMLPVEAFRSELKV